MYSTPAKLRDIEQITTSLQEYGKKFLACDKLHAEIIPNDIFNALVPSLVTQFDELGVKLDIVKYFVTPPNTMIPIHKDGDKQYPKYWALNLPVFNCENTYMVWYDAETVVKFQHNNMYSPYEIHCYSKDHCKEIEKLNMLEPSWVRVDIPHSALNEVNTTNRVVLSIRFDVTQNKDWYPQ